MLDGFKILNLHANIQELLNNDLLLFPLPVNENSGDIMNNPRNYEYKGLIFTIKNNNVKLKGSFHKYHNNGLHNYNDFYFQDIVKTINELSELFNIDIKKSILNNLEFGVNIHIKQKTDIVFQSIINYKGISFQKFTISGAKGIECITDNFYIKIYDKSKQYNRPGNILRFEIKVKRMKFFEHRNININSLLSITDYTEICKLTSVLLTVLNEILFTDYFINQDSLKPRERLIFSNGNNPKYWELLKPESKNFVEGNNDKQYISERKKYYRELDNFKRIISKYSTSTLKKDLYNLIEKKCNELLNIDIKTVDKFTEIINQKQNIKSGQIHISNIGGFCPLSDISINRVCLTCKRDISEKKKTAKFCCKKCKNNFTNPLLNPKNNLLKMIHRKKRFDLLFDLSEYIVLTDYQTELLNRKNTIQNYL